MRLVLRALFVLALVCSAATDNPCAGGLEPSAVGPYFCALGQVWGLVDVPGNHTLSALLDHASPDHLLVIYMQVFNSTFRFSIPETIGEFSALRVIATTDGVIGPLPASMGRLTGLVELYLEEAETLGELPSELGLLTDLRSFSISNSPGTGVFPPQVWGLSNLVYFEISGGNFSGSIPVRVGQLTQLVHLKCDSNRFEGSLPSELGLLTALTLLSAKNNFLDGLLPSELGLLVGLMELDLSNNGLSGFIPSELGLLTNLKRLDLSENQFVGFLPLEIGNLVRLQELDVSSNRLVGTLPRSVGLLTNLRSLDVSHNRLSGSLPRQLGALLNLRVLYLNDNKFNGNPENIARSLPQLRDVVIENNEFSGSLSTHLLRWLRKCYLSGLGNYQCRALCDCDIWKFEVEYQQADSKCLNRGCMSLAWFLVPSVLLGIATLCALLVGSPVSPEGTPAHGTAKWKRGFKGKFFFAAAAVLVDTFQLMVGALAVFSHQAFFVAWLVICSSELLGALGLAVWFSNNVSKLRWWECTLCTVAPRALMAVVTNASKRIGNNKSKEYYKARVKIAWFKLALSLAECAVQLASAIVGDKWDALVIMATGSAGMAVLVSLHVLAAKQRAGKSKAFTWARKAYYYHASEQQ